MGRTFRLGRIFGIPIGLHWSLLLILFWILYSFTGTFKEITGDQTSAFLYATAFAVLFYVSILLHELGHAFAARRNNIGISGIDLWMLGGLAKMTRDPDTAGAEFKVAAAGPLVTVVIAVVLIIGAAIGFSPDAVGDNSPFSVSRDESPLLALITFLASLNVVLLVFYLVTALPLDGGRIARSIAWKLTGDRTKATKFAATLGQLFSYLMIGLGIFMMIRGDLAGGIIWVFLGLFIGDAARTAVVQTSVLSRIEGLSVEDVMDREPVAVPADMTIEQAMDEFFLRYRYPWFPVVDSNGRYVGVVELERAERVAVDKQPVFKVNEIMRAEGDQFRVLSDDPLDALLSSEALRRLGALIAVDRDGQLEGIVTVEQVSRALQRGAAH